jgi:hypothetical protein
VNELRARAHVDTFARRVYFRVGSAVAFILSHSLCACLVLVVCLWYSTCTFIAGYSFGGQVCQVWGEADSPLKSVSTSFITRCRVQACCAAALIAGKV